MSVSSWRTPPLADPHWLADPPPPWWMAGALGLYPDKAYMFGFCHLSENEYISDICQKLNFSLLWLQSETVRHVHWSPQGLNKTYITDTHFSCPRCLWPSLPGRPPGFLRGALGSAGRILIHHCKKKKKSVLQVMSGNIRCCSRISKFSIFNFTSGPHDTGIVVRFDLFGRTAWGWFSAHGSRLHGSSCHSFCLGIFFVRSWQLHLRYVQQKHVLKFHLETLKKAPRTCSKCGNVLLQEMS